MFNLANWWRHDGTKYIGLAQGVVAALCGIAGIIPESHLKYYLAASAVMTFLRGYLNDWFTANPPTTTNP